MSNRVWLLTGILLSLLSITLSQSVSAQEGTPDSSSCGPSVPEQPIPDDGRWLQICLLDPMAPEATTVTTVHLKYWIDHPEPGQLEVYLSRESDDPRQLLWEQGKLAAGTEFGKAADLTSFEGSPSQGPWYLWIRDVVPGEQGVLRDVSLVIDYRPPSPCRSRLMTLRRIPGRCVFPEGCFLPPPLIGIQTNGSSKVYSIIENKATR